jgi:hypothetical protein
MNEEIKKFTFLGIGVPKSGTTFAYQCIREHPEISVISSKDGHPKSIFWAGEKNLLDNKFKFPENPNAKAFGEFRESFYVHPEIVEKVREVNPNMKFVVCLRNPYERAYSAYRHIHSLRNTFPNIKELVDKKDASYILNKGYMANHLESFIEQFPIENFLFVYFEDLKLNPVRYAQEIYRFLGVNERFIPEVATSKTKVNDTNFKGTGLGRALHNKVFPALRTLGIIQRIKRGQSVRNVFYKFSSWYGKRSNLKNEMPKKEDFMRDLGDLYNEDLTKLEEITGKNLSHWKQ